MVSIKGFEKENILSFSLTKKVNSHSECNIELLTNEDYENYLEKIDSELVINNEDDFLFCGYIDKVTAEPNLSRIGSVIKIHAFSNSKHIDCKQKKRIFQNPDKDLKEIYDFIKQKSESEIIFEGKDKISQPVLQNNETDFEFILKQSLVYGYQVFIDDCDKNLKNGRIYIDKHLNSSPIKLKELEETPEQLLFSITSENSSKKDIAKFILNNTYLKLGQIVTIGNIKRYVAEIKIELNNHNLYKYHYVLYDLDSICNFNLISEQQPVSLKAIVTDNIDPENKGRIKVKFDCDFEDTEPAKQMWINWQTPYMTEKGGFIFVPDKDDIVEVVYNDNEFVATQIIARKSLDEKFKNVKDKYIANIFGRMINFKENELELISGDNKIVMGDDSILLQVKDKAKIVIKENKIELNAGNGDLTLKGSNILLN